jgi:hypothetical protein
MLLPPGFFNPMQHMILHIPQEVLKGGPVQFCWQFGLERVNKDIQHKTGNKNKPETSIAEATPYRGGVKFHDKVL